MSGEASKIERAKALKAVRDILPDTYNNVRRFVFGEEFVHYLTAV